MAATDIVPLPALTKEDMIPRREQMANFERLAHNALGPPPPTLTETWIDIPLKDGWLSHTLVVHPKPTSPEPSHPHPLTIHFFGGGHVVGSPLQLTLPARVLAEKFNATVLCPSYRLAPEHPWPQDLADGLEILQVVAASPEYQFGANLAHGFIVGGVSAGACIAAVATGLLSADPEKYPIAHPVTGAFLAVGAYLAEGIVPPEYKSLWTSRDDNRHAQGFDTATLDQIYETWKVTDYSSPWFSPVNLFTGPATSSHGSSTIEHPPTYFQAMGLDPLRDDTIVYERVLAANGTRTKLDLFKDDAHGAWTTLTEMMGGTRSKGMTVEEGTLEGVGWLLGGAKGKQGT